MNRLVIIVVCSYVRDPIRSRFPAIRNVSAERFCRQLDYIQARCTRFG